MRNTKHRMRLDEFVLTAFILLSMKIKKIESKDVLFPITPYNVEKKKTSHSIIWPFNRGSFFQTFIVAG